MHAYPLWSKIWAVLTAAAVAFTLAGAPAAVASEPTPAWLSAIGDFVRDGLEPPRTAEDLLREESRQATQPSPASVRVAAPLPVHVAEPAPAPVAAPAPAPVEPVFFAPPPVESPAPVVETAAPVPAPVPAMARAPRTAVAPAEIKARPVVRAASRNMPVPQPAAEPLTGNRIAATATLDQAMKLGGPAGLYAQRVKRPQTTQ